MPQAFVYRCGRFRFIWHCEQCHQEVYVPEHGVLLVDETPPADGSGHPTAYVHRHGCLEAWQASHTPAWADYTALPGLVEEFWRDLWLGPLLAEARDRSQLLTGKEGRT